VGYIRDNLMSNEEVIHMAKIHWYIYIPGLTMVILSFVTIAFMSELKEAGPFILMILFIGGFISLIKAFIFKISTELAITTKRVIAKTGLIKRETLELNHSKVESFSIDQSILGRLLDFGSIVVRGTGGGKTPIPSIDAPMTFRKEAMQIIDKVENN